MAARTSGYNEGWLLAMVLLGLLIGVLVAFLPLAALTALGLLVYLVGVLIRPERF